ncbi:MAG: hypothetical protein EXR45_08835 [Chloroflexi bacterium]|nr:hypothetical protein [Chloroflexota bacterium]
MGLESMARAVPDQGSSDPPATVSRVWTVAPYALFLSVGGFLFPSAGRDDAFITYWAAHTLARFGEIVNYDGDRVEQSSSVLHTVLLGILHAATGINLPTLGVTVSAGAAVIAIWLIGRLAHLIGTPRTLAQVYLATATPFLYWAFGGLETTLNAAAVIGFLIAYYAYRLKPDRARLLAFAATTTAILTVRPETFLIVGGFLVATGSIEVHLRRAWLEHLHMGAVATALTGLQFAWRWSYFGSLLPQPVAAKVGPQAFALDRITGGITYALTTIGQYPVVVLSLVMAIAFARGVRRPDPIRSRMAPLAVFVAIYILFVLTSGGDWMEGGRFFVPILAPAIILAFCWYGPVLTRGSVIITIVGINIATSCLFAQEWSTSSVLGDRSFRDAFPTDTTPYSWFEAQNRTHYRDLIFLNAVRPVIDFYVDAVPNEPLVIMSGQAGLVPFHLVQEHYGRLRFIDQFGLTTRDFTGCVMTSKTRRDVYGLPVSLERYIQQRDALEAVCNIAPPAFIFELDTIDGREARFIAEHGYVVLVQESGILAGAYPFRGEAVQLNQFLGVREDLVEAYPYPGLRNPAPLSRLDG